MKELIKNKNGRVVLCDSNIAKMNIFEFMYYHRYIVVEDLVSTLKDFFELIIPILTFILLPIIYPFIALYRIQKAKKEVQKYKDREKI